MSGRLRLVAFASAALALLAITGVLAWREPVPAHHQAPQSRAPAIRTGPTRALEPSAAPSSSATAAPPAPQSSTRSSAAAGEPEQEADDAPAVAPAQARPATAAARAFLHGYLAYTYGHADARVIRAASRALRRELEASPPRVAATIARARPRVISVRASAATGRLGIDVHTIVDDGQRRYGIRLAVRGDGGPWLVVAVGG